MLDEPHQTSAAESKTVSSAVVEEEIVEDGATDLQVIQRITRFHSGPLPDPETLSAYAKLIPNGADRSNEPRRAPDRDDINGNLLMHVRQFEAIGWPTRSPWRFRAQASTWVCEAMTGLRPPFSRRP